MSNLTDVRFNANGLIAMLQQIVASEDVTELRPTKAQRQMEHRNDRRSTRIELAQYVLEVE